MAEATSTTPATNSGNVNVTNANVANVANAMACDISTASTPMAGMAATNVNNAMSQTTDETTNNTSTPVSAPVSTSVATPIVPLASTPQSIPILTINVNRTIASYTSDMAEATNTVSLIDSTGIDTTSMTNSTLDAAPTPTSNINTNTMPTVNININTMPTDNTSTGNIPTDRIESNMAPIANDNTTESSLANIVVNINVADAVPGMTAGTGSTSMATDSSMTSSTSGYAPSERTHHRVYRATYISGQPSHQAICVETNPTNPESDRGHMYWVWGILKEGMRFEDLPCVHPFASFNGHTMQHVGWVRQGTSVRDQCERVPVPGKQWDENGGRIKPRTPIRHGHHWVADVISALRTAGVLQPLAPSDNERVIRRPDSQHT